jgi:hypothetical protein
LRAIRTVVIGHNLELTLARQLAASIPINTLRTPEKAFIADWIVQPAGQ